MNFRASSTWEGLELMLMPVEVRYVFSFREYAHLTTVVGILYSFDDLVPESTQEVGLPTPRFTRSRVAGPALDHRSSSQTDRHLPSSAAMVTLRVSDFDTGDLNQLREALASTSATLNSEPDSVLSTRRPNSGFSIGSGAPLLAVAFQRDIIDGTPTHIINSQLIPGLEAAYACGASPTATQTPH